jgi:carboxymethylenebutenolidase
MRVSFVVLAAAAAVVAAVTGATQLRSTPALLAHAQQSQVDHNHADAAPSSVVAGAKLSAQQAGGVPASGAEAAARLAASPRRGEWHIIKVGADSVATWIVRPQGSAPAPVVVVIHENTGLTTWNRAVADQMAADGFIAVAPDLITMKRTGGDIRTDWPQDQGRAAIGSLTDAEAQRLIDGVAKYAMALPNAVAKYGIVGFCWGGARSFLHAVHAPGLAASVVYYGAAPTAEQMNSIRAPVLGLYGGNDARITGATPGVDSTMKRLGKTYEFHVFDGAGHGFLRAQEAGGGPNATAARAAWPLTVAWFRKHLAG